MRLFCVSDKELRFVGIGARVSHGDYSSCVKLIKGKKRSVTRPPTGLKLNRKSRNEMAAKGDYRVVRERQAASDNHAIGSVQNVRMLRRDYVTGAAFLDTGLQPFR